MRTQFVMAVMGGLLIGLGLSHLSVPRPAQSQESKPAKKPAEAAKKPAEAAKKPAEEAKKPAEAAKKPAEAAELDRLKASAAAFEKAFNAGDAKAIAAQFTENAEVVDDDGNVIEGRANIEARFAELFKEYPKARIDVAISSLKQLSPDVAVEDGYSTTTLSPDEPGSRSPYTLVHVKRDGKWLFASVRDFPEETAETTAHDQLQSLEWLVGHWVDESSDGRVETTCQWSEDGNYLLQDYVVKARRGELRGTQRIAWDPLRRTIRSWAFDHSGAFTETSWTPIEDAWILKVEGVTPEGQGASATRAVTPINGDSFQIDSTSVVVGNELLPNSTVRVVRRPPPPAQ